MELTIWMMVAGIAIFGIGAISGWLLGRASKGGMKATSARQEAFLDNAAIDLSVLEKFAHDISVYAADIKKKADHIERTAKNASSTVQSAPEKPVTAKLIDPREVTGLGPDAELGGHAQLDNQSHPTIILDEKSGGYSVALGSINGTARVLIRYNGDHSHTNKSEAGYLGSPSWKNAKWFVLPEFLGDLTLAAAHARQDRLFT